jgi:predicted NAD/FAD-binding protein
MASAIMAHANLQARPRMTTRLKIAVVGAGLGGLAAAWLLGRQHAVTLFERQARPGFTAANVPVPGRGSAGNAVRVDVPLRVFYPGYYPTLVRLYDELGVSSEPVSYASSLCGADGALFFRYRNVRIGERRWSYLLPQDLRGARARQILRGVLRFYREGLAAWRAGELADLTLEAFLRQRDFPQDFIDGLLLPALSTIATCSYASARLFPAEVVMGYLGVGLMQQCVRRACEGADDVAERLLRTVHEGRHAPLREALKQQQERP